MPGKPSYKVAKPHYQKLRAKKYYGQHATGTVILRNGQPIFHGNPKDAGKIWKRIQEETKKQ